jgi:SAM-dependent methyltransferase
LNIGKLDFLKFLEEETKEIIKKKMEKIPNCEIISGEPREDGTIDILIFNIKGKMSAEELATGRIKGKVKDVYRSKGIFKDVSIELKQQIYDKLYFESKEKAKDQLPYETKYNQYSLWAVGIKMALPLIERVLDIGCGRGEFVRGFNKIGIEAHGVDISEYSIKDGLSRAPFLNGKLHICDIDKDRLPFSDEYFDLIISINTIEHICSPSRFVEESKRVLKPGRCILVVTHIPGSKYDIGDITHLNTRSKDEWIKLFRRHGIMWEEGIEKEILQKLMKYKPSATPEKWEGKKEERKKRLTKLLEEERITLIFYK